MIASARIVHGVGVGALGLELLVAGVLATGIAGLLASRSRPAALGVACLCLAGFLPAVAAAILLGPVAGVAGLTVAMLPCLTWGWLRLPAGQWRTARALNGSALRVARVLVAPALAPFLCAALLLGVAALGLRWRLDSHPAPLVLPDPVTATG